MQAASGETAQAAIDYVLRTTIGKGLDQKLVSSDAETEEAPAGLLFGATQVDGSASMSADLSALVGQISSAEINTATGVVFIASPARAMSIELTAGSHWSHKIVASRLVTNDVVIAVVPSGILVAGDGTDVRIDISKQTVLHMADPASQIVPIGGPISAPSLSMMQQDLLALRVIMMINWAVAPGCVSYATGCTW